MATLSGRGPVIIRQFVLAAMYFFSFVKFGATVWPSALTALVIFIVGLLNIERRLFSVIGVILFLIAVGISLSLLPRPDEWKL